MAIDNNDDRRKKDGEDGGEWVFGGCLIIGGAYQGKLSYALERFGYGDGDVHTCGEALAIPEGQKIIDKLERWILALVRADMDVLGELRRMLRCNTGAIVICTDISCGLVPVEADLRQWREAVGRSLALLAGEADEVVRLFCGIPTRIK